MPQLARAPAWQHDLANSQAPGVPAVTRAHVRFALSMSSSQARVPGYMPSILRGAAARGLSPRCSYHPDYFPILDLQPLAWE
jgi:hypothetical protein